MDCPRKQYMDGAITFHAYYGLLVEALGENALRRIIPAPVEEVRAKLAEDEHLNNIRLPLWDRSDYNVRQLVRGRLAEVEAITGSRGWSLSDTVCTLKCAARRWVEASATV
jgi:hypothetical protein